MQDMVGDIIQDVVRETISRIVTGRKPKKEPDVDIVEQCNSKVILLNSSDKGNASKCARPSSSPASPACTPGQVLAAALAKKMLEELGQQRGEADQKMSSLGLLTSTSNQAHQRPINHAIPGHHQIFSGGAECFKQGQRKKEEDREDLEVMRKPGRRGWVREVVYSRVRAFLHDPEINYEVPMGRAT